MKKRLENILKRYSSLNKLYTFIGSMIIKIVSLFLKENENTILFVSYMGKNFNDSPKVIYDKIIQDPYFKDYTFIWAFNDTGKYEIKNKNTIKVKMDSFEYLKTALQASYWVTNVNIERGLHFKKNYTQSINTWHGVPLKKIGNDVRGRNDFNFSDTDVFCYSGDYEYEIYKRAFNLTDKNLYKIGMPRNDKVLKNEKDVANRVKESLSIYGKKIILYAPTWREDSNDLRLMDLIRWEKVLSDDYVLLIKVHGLNEQFNINENSFVRDVSDYEETSELIIASDLLITDYSSIMFDFALTGKPIFIYMTDYDKYVSERGTYFNLKEIDLPIFEEDHLLLDRIKTNEYKTEENKSMAFGKKFIDVRNPNASNNIIKLMKEGIK